MLTVAIIGSNGVIGTYLVPLLISSGYKLHLINRTISNSTYSHNQVLSFTGNILNRDSLIKALDGCHVVINIATSIPANGQDWIANDLIRRDGTHNLINSCNEVGIKYLIQQSIAMLYHDSYEQWLDENSPFKPNIITQSALDMENIICASNLSWLILRGGLLYGPGSNREDKWLSNAKKGKLIIPKNKHDYISLIHVQDYAMAYLCALNSNIKNKAFNIVDNKPVTYDELYGFIYNKVGGMPNLNNEQIAPFAFRVKNQLAKDMLNWMPYFSNYQEGLNKIYNN